MKIGLIREGKTPVDTRVALTPGHIRRILDNPDNTMQFFVEASPDRCFQDHEYQLAGIPITHSVHDCDVLLGVKEVPVDQLIAGKTYFFFSHTIKKQPHNRHLLQTILKKGIRLIDYELITDDQGNRVIAFGKFAGMVGAHNGLWTYGQRTGLFALPRMYQCRDYAAVKAYYKTVRLPPVKIVVTGKGRVGNGAAMVLRDMGIRQVPPDAYLLMQYNAPVFTQIDADVYSVHKEGKPFSFRDFFKSPSDYASAFLPFAQASDIMINGIYWDPAAPAFFTRAEMQDPDFRIKTIADITCDIAPESSVPSTLRATTIDDPVYGFDPATAHETPPFNKDGIDMMTIDNLPNELPRDASTAFGEHFIEHVMPEIDRLDTSVMLQRATIAQSGTLTTRFKYLEDFVSGKE